EIRALESNGVNVRADPGYNGRIISTILNGTLVEVLSEVEVVDSITWVHIRLPDQTEGWIVRDFLISSTPAPDW
ncbi:MAG: SH3 domain-containing protein, partial [Anaerolineaceae bacterium]|nr:SH3 domain-containing protein [Anaerolineaceae bacterium]